MRYAEGVRAAAGLLAGAGVPPEPAHRTAALLCLTDLWGIPSHGLFRLPFYLQRLRAGGITADAQLRVAADTGAAVVYDGGGGLGHWQTWAAAEEAAARAARHGVGLAGVRESSHCGALGLYTQPPLRRGQLTLVLSHGPAVMPPAGGSRPVLSTSPVAAGVPRPGGPPMIADLALSAVARGAVAAAAGRGEPLAPGLALDAAGAPTTDARAALDGMLAPIGGAKGAVLALVVEAFTAGLLGPCLSAEVADVFAADDAGRRQGVGHLLLAIDVAALAGGDGHARLARMAAAVEAAGGRVPGAGRVALEDVDDAAELRLDPAVEGHLREHLER